MREAKADEANYLLYLSKREEARIDDAMDNRRISNVALAQMPAVPALPLYSPWLVIFLGGMLALLVSSGLAFAAEYLDPSFRTADEVSETLDLPVFASIPKNGH
jgi:capsular polysaccharide biosynthesis protein